MRKAVVLTGILVYILFCLSSFANGLKIGYLAPSKGAFATFSESFLNGLYLGISQDTSVIMQDSSNNNLEQDLENLYLAGADVVIGPFIAQNINKIEKKLCESDIVTILPFARAQYNCDNIFIYNYDPIEAAKQLANKVCLDNSSSVLLMYSYSNLNIMKKNAFIEAFSSFCKKHLYTQGFDVRKNYDDLVRSIFNVQKIKDEGILLSDEDVFIHSFDVDNVIIFAPQNDFLSIANMMDYYDVEPKNIFSTDVTINEQLLSTKRGTIKKIHFITPYYLCNNSTINREFLEKYRKEYQTTPDFMAALGFDIGRILKDSDRVSLKAKLASMSDFEGLIGTLLFFDDNHKALIDYKMVNHKEIRICKKMTFKQ